jgi:hypothetical protein
MAGKKKSKQHGSKPASGRPSTDGADSGTAQKTEISARLADKRPPAADPGAVKLHSPVGPLMWLLIPFVLCILIAVLKKI